MYKTNHIPTAEIFRAYDIRGIFSESLCPKDAYVIGRSIATIALRTKESIIHIAYDGRLSSPILCEALTAGILDSGCHVRNIGAVPTPVLYFACMQQHGASGIMITGSHNPKNYNGFKVMIAKQTLAAENIQAIHHVIESQQFSQGHGHVTHVSIEQSYIDTICQKIKLARPLTVVIDAGNGICGELAPKIFTQLNCRVIPLFCEIDGNFPNHHPDPTHPKNLQDLVTAVKQHGADCGIAFDGDGDRVGLVTNQGEMIFADELMILLAPSILQAYPNHNFLYDVKCSKHLATVVKQAGGNPVMIQTGHSLIKQALAKDPLAIFAGEMSGHIFFNDTWYGFDDAIYSAARFLEVLSQKIANEKIDFSSWYHTLPVSVKTPEIALAIDEKHKFDIIKKIVTNMHFENANIILIDGIRVEFADGFGLIRASNTTPTLVARFEADNQIALKRILNDFINGLQPYALQLNLDELCLFEGGLNKG